MGFITCLTCIKVGAPGGVRTRDTQIKSLVLYQLSYRSILRELVLSSRLDFRSSA